MLFFSFSIMGALSFLLLGTGYLKAQPRSRSAQLYFCISICLVFYFLNTLTFVWVDEPYRFPPGFYDLFLNWIPNAVPGLFMIFCYSLFEDKNRISLWLVYAVIIYFLLCGAWLILYSNISSVPFPFNSRPFGEAVTLLLDICILAFAVAALFWTIKGWRNDLVESRRVLRWLFVLFQGTVILAVVGSEHFFANTDQYYKLSQQVTVFSLAPVAFIAVLILATFDTDRINGLLERLIARNMRVAANNFNNDGDTEVFNQKFIEQKFYRQNDLTIAKVAKYLSMPEYRVRRLINKELGFRNFNSMLNHFRINDACDILCDPSNNKLPILTIALELGYNSINPFNSAFRSIKGTTPSEFRKSVQNIE